MKIIALLSIGVKILLLIYVVCDQVLETKLKLSYGLASVTQALTIGESKGRSGFTEMLVARTASYTMCIWLWKYWQIPVLTKYTLTRLYYILILHNRQTCWKSSQDE